MTFKCPVLHSVFYFPECSLEDLLSCSGTTTTRDNTSCCDVNGLCVTVTGVSIGSVATYSTSNNYCIKNQTTRTCTSDMVCSYIAWSGTTPNATEKGLFCSALVNNIIIHFPSHLLSSYEIEQ